MGPKRASVTLFGVELYVSAKLESFGLSSGAGDGEVAHVDLEARLRETLSGRWEERLAVDDASGLEQLLRYRAVDVSAVDEPFPDDQFLSLDIDLEWLGRFLLWPIGRGYSASEDELGVEVSGDVAFIAIETLALALSAVAHLGVLDGDTAIWR